MILKKSLIVFLILTMIAVLAACGGNQQETSGNQKQNDTAQQPSTSDSSNDSSENQNDSANIDFPTEPITLIVSFGAGGGTDLGARVLVQYVEEELGVPISIVNKAGGGGWVGWTDLVNAKPDGYTIGYLNTPNLITGYMNPELGREHTVESFTTIGNHVTDGGVIAVRADDDRFATIEDLIAYAKDNELTTTSTGLGSDDHNAALKVNKAQGTKFKAVHTGGFGENKANVLGGHVDVFFANVGELTNDHNNGVVKVLAVMLEERSSYLPDVPTLKELGYGDIYSWSARGIAGPQGIDPEILAILEAAFEKGINNAEQKAKMDELGLDIDYRNSNDYAAMLKEEEEGVLEILNLLGW